MSFPQCSYFTLCLVSWIYQEWIFYASGNANWFFYPQTESITLKDTYIYSKLLASTHLYTSTKHQKLVIRKKVCKPALVLLVLGMLSRNYKNRKLFLLPCMYRDILNFTLKLTATLLQMLATFCTSNVKQNDH